MGSGKSRSSQERERELEKKEREKLQRARLDQLREKIKLEIEKELLYREREDLAIKAKETQQLQDALTQRQLYPNLNIVGSPRNESFQTTAVPNLAANHDHFRFEPTAPPAPFAPLLQPPEDRAPRQRPYKPVTKTVAVAAPQATTRLICPNAADGCILSFNQSELAKHKKECPYRELKCPYLGNCNWRGKLPQLSIHFDEEHPSSRQANVDTESFLRNIENEFNSLQLMKIGTYNFLFYIKVSEAERRVYMAVQLIGTKISAAKWYYEIHVYNKSEPRRKYRYVDSCQSSDETNRISLRSCAVLPLSYAKSFFNEGKFTYKIYIKKK